MLAEGEGPYAGLIRSTDVRRGRDRYFVVCGPCHEHDQLAPPLFDLGWSAAEVRHQIREGNALMPPIRPARLTDADIETLLSYLVTIGTVREEFAAVEAEVPEVETPPAERDAGVEGIAASEGSTTSEGVEADVDAGVEGSVSAGPIDASVDAGVDAGVDAAPVDAGVDAAPVDTAPVDAGPTP